MITIFTGCGSSLLNGSTLSMSKHVDTSESTQTSEDTLYASNYDELYNAVLTLAKNYLNTGIIQVNSYPGEISDDIERICQEITHNEPYGAYAIYYMNTTVTRIVSYYEIEVNITYSRSQSQIKALHTAPNVRYFNSGIMDCLENASLKYAVYTNETITAEYIKDYITGLYYDNPLSIPALPTVDVSIYPSDVPEGKTRIIDVTFSYPLGSATLKGTLTELSKQVQELTEQSSGSSDGELLLSLCRSLCQRVEYSEQSNGDVMYGTAYYTLHDKIADSFGYAMAYKALCDRLGLDCQVVVGRLNGIDHAWNIVGLDGDYYHVDVSMCDLNGEETAFMLSDADIISSYWWDDGDLPKCNGMLRYDDFNF
jgi:hypothetical protein